MLSVDVQYKSQFFISFLRVDICYSFKIKTVVCLLHAKRFAFNYICLLAFDDLPPWWKVRCFKKIEACFRVIAIFFVCTK